MVSYFELHYVFHDSICGREESYRLFQMKKYFEDYTWGLVYSIKLRWFAYFYRQVSEEKLREIFTNLLMFSDIIKRWKEKRNYS